MRTQRERILQAALKARMGLARSHVLRILRTQGPASPARQAAYPLQVPVWLVQPAAMLTALDWVLRQYLTVIVASGTSTTFRQLHRCARVPPVTLPVWRPPTKRLVVSPVPLAVMQTATAHCPLRSQTFSVERVSCTTHRRRSLCASELLVHLMKWRRIKPLAAQHRPGVRMWTVTGMDLHL